MMLDLAMAVLCLESAEVGNLVCLGRCVAIVVVVVEDGDRCDCDTYHVQVVQCGIEWPWTDNRGE